MSIFLYSFILWLPYAFLAALYIIIYCIFGYKNGFFKSIISVAASLVAGVVSAGFALVVSPLITGFAYDLVFSLLPSVDMGAFSKFAESFTKGFLQGFVSLVLFSGALFFTSIIAKGLAGLILRKKLAPKSKWMRWTGVLIRLGEALVFVLILLLPLYGTLSTYTPVVKELFSLTARDTENENIEVAEALLETIENHPLTQTVSKTALSEIYNAVSVSEVGGNNVSIPKMVNSVNGLLDRVEALKTMPQSRYKDAVTDIVVYLEDEFVGEKWVYELYVSFKNEMVDLYEVNSVEMTEDDEEKIELLISAFDMNEEEFKECFGGGLEFVEFFLKNNYYEKIHEEGTDCIFNREFFAALGKLMNCSDKALSVKQIFILIPLENVNADNGGKIALEMASSVKLHDNEEEQIREAWAFVLSLKNARKVVSAQSLVIHPDYDFDTVMTLFDLKQTVIDEFYYYDTLPQYLTEHPEFYEQIKQLLKDYDAAEVNDVSYYEQILYLLSSVEELRTVNGFFMSGDFEGSVDVGTGVIVEAAIDENGKVIYKYK